MSSDLIGAFLCTEGGDCTWQLAASMGARLSSMAIPRSLCTFFAETINHVEKEGIPQIISNDFWAETLIYALFPAFIRVENFEKIYLHLLST